MLNCLRPTTGRSRLLAAGLLFAAAAPAQAPLDPVSWAASACKDHNGGTLPQCEAAVEAGAAAARLPRRSPAAAAVPVIKTPARVERHAETTERPEPAPEIPLPPEPPTEFQQFLSAATGRLLPIFGAELFEHAPSTFAPVDRIPVTADYTLGPGDEVVVRTWGQVQFDLQLTIDRQGAVFLPQAGAITLAGVPYAQVQTVLRRHLERVYRNFELTVSLGQLRSIQVLVVGQARRPGVYTVSSLSTLINALFACGGPSSQGSMRRILLKRDGRQIAEFDIYALLLEGDRSQDRRLLSGDVIQIAGVGPQAALAGSIRRAAVYELRGKETVADLVAIAGGPTPVADRSRLRLERVVEGRRNAVDLALDSPAGKTELHSGDLIQIAALTPAFENAVTLRGNVANPGRFAWHTGLRLRDILPDKESLVTRAYWVRHNLIGHAVVRYQPAAIDEAPDPPPAPARLAALPPPIDWSYAVIERRHPRDLSRQLVPFHLGRLVLENDIAENHELRPGDIVTIFSQRDIQVPVSQQSRQVTIEGEVGAPGLYEIKEGETLGQLIQRAGGLTNQAYLYGAEFTRESARHAQQERIEQYARDLERDLQQAASRQPGLGGADETLATRLDGAHKLVERLRATRASGRIALGFSEKNVSLDPLMHIPLEDGDRFVVPVRPATVNVLGAVYNTGSLLHQSDWRVRDYLNRAGGCNRTADAGRVYLIRADGTVLSRQSFGRFGPSFEMTHVHPGDSIVVPQSLPKGSILRGIRDWSQLSSQMALSAATVSVLR